MNASLKILEEPPEYAIILLVVANPESILETIHSRTITLFQSKWNIHLSKEQQNMIQQYFEGIPDDLIAYLYLTRYDEQTAIMILMEALNYAEKSMIDRIEQWLIELFQVNESPRNILDRVFLMNI